VGVGVVDRDHRAGVEHVALGICPISS
jgi:hypothetical protein